MTEHPMTEATPLASEQITQEDREAAISTVPDDGSHSSYLMVDAIERGAADDWPLVQAFARHRIAALSASPAPSGQGVSGEVVKLTTAADVKAAVRAWLDADDATHWGAFEAALDAAISGTSERALIVAMLRADAETMRANADAYSEEAPTDARALHEVAATLGFKAAQIERGDHLDATPKAQDREAATFQAIHEAMMDKRDGKPCGCIIERGCEAAGYHDPESAADSFKADAVQRVLALAAPAPSCAPGEDRDV